jgi:TolB protein
MGLMPAASASFDGPNGKVLFARVGEGIWSVRPDGGNPTQLTDSGVAPVASPDGTQIAFLRRRENEVGEFKMVVFVMNADGSGAERVSGPLRGDAQNLAWSPDGRWIAYEDLILVTEGEQVVPRSAIFVVRPNGNERTRLTTYGSRHSNPSWAPGSLRLAFTTPAGLFTISRTQLEKQQVLNAELSPDEATWSPTSSTIAFTATLPPAGDASRSAIYTVRADGTQLVQRTEGGSADVSPQWSPDGTRFSFMSWPGAAENPADLWVMNANGSSMENLTAESDRPVNWRQRQAWSPDGTQIAFFIRGDIFRVNAGGGPVNTVVDNSVRESSLDWAVRPAG